MAMSPELEAELTALLKRRREEEPGIVGALQRVADWQNGHDAMHAKEEEARRSMTWRLQSLEAVSSRRTGWALAVMALLLALGAGFEVGNNTRSGASALHLP